MDNMQSNYFSNEFKTFKYKTSTNVIIKFQNGNGIIVIFQKIKKRFNKIYKFNNSLIIRNYRELLKMLNVNVIMKSNEKIRLKDLHKIIFMVSQILNLQKFKENISSNKEIQKIQNNPQLNFTNTKSHLPKIFIFLFFTLLIFLIFLLDYNTIKTKINKENELKLKEYENEYSINKCVTKGHLQALKSTCKNLEDKISIHRKEGVSTLSILIIWIIENFNHIINILGTNNFIFLVLIFIIILYKFI